jgi:hypothetical protein
VRPGPAEQDAELVGERAELLAPLAHPRRRLGEALTAAGADLDLRRDQLADEMLLELRPARGGLQLLEAVRQRQRLGIEDRELLLDCDVEILGRLEGRAGNSEELVRGELVGHGRRRLRKGF